MNLNKYLVGSLILLLASSCYKDKGHYDYSDVNDFDIVLTPAAPAEDNIFLVNQPGAIAETFTLKASAEQTITTSNDNIEYTWYRSAMIEGQSDIIADTITGAENTMEFPPFKKMIWEVMLVARDKNTDLELHKSLIIKTKTPFANGWFFMHGEEGQRKLGSLQWDANGNHEWIPDVLEKMGQKPFAHMTSFTYLSSGNYEDMRKGNERLYIVSSPDSLSCINPFTCKMQKNAHTVGFPVNKGIKGKVIGSQLSSQPYCGVIDEDGKFWFGENFGTFSLQDDPNSPDYCLDCGFTNTNGEFTLWDNTNKKLMYYAQWQFGTLSSSKTGNLSDLEVLWAGKAPIHIGQGDPTPALFIMKNEKSGKCYLYTIDYSEGKGDKSTKGGDNVESGIGNVSCDSTNVWNFTDKTRFAVSNYFEGQIFFTENNTIYVGITAGKEKRKLYTPQSGTIKDIKFRMAEESSVVDFNDNVKVLGIIVTNNGKDEFHEIKLSNAGTVDEAKVYDLGNITIEDWDFSGMTRLADK